MSTNINIDKELELKANLILNDLGLDMATAYNIFLRQIVEKEAIPFKISKSKPKSKAKSKNKKIPRSEFIGIWKDKIWMADDFDAPLEDMKEYME